jgi:hypothetical protein
MMDDKKLPVGFGQEGRKRAREIQLLVNIISPDPNYQPYYLADNATLFDVRDQEAQTVQQRLEGYFGSPLRFQTIARQPLWQLVDQIKELYPGWPNDWE